MTTSQASSATSQTPPRPRSPARLARARREIQGHDPRKPARRRGCRRTSSISPSRSPASNRRLSIARSGAGGMWQFMPTGAYGLSRNGWFDERFDPEKSSRAYARYMKTLYNQFGDWYLAMAAYDWGPGNVQRAVMRTGYADFWELYRRNVLPGETKNYVPGIIAAIIMAKNPDAVRARQACRRHAGCRRHRHHRLRHRSSTRCRCHQRLASRDRLSQPKPAADDNPA